MGLRFGAWWGLAFFLGARFSEVAHRRGGPACARPRLRSGAFAPDSPFVILVRLRLPSDSLGRIEVARSQGHRADGLPVSWAVALLGCALVTSAAGPAEWRPRGRPYSAYASVGVWAVVAFANVGSRLLVVPRTFWEG